MKITNLNCEAILLSPQWPILSVFWVVLKNISSISTVAGNMVIGNRTEPEGHQRQVFSRGIGEQGSLS